jgi:hypothetical protein
MWSLGKVLEKVAKGWAQLTCVLFVLASLWIVLNGTFLGDAYDRGYFLGSYFVECIVWGLIPAGLIYAIARALQRHGHP